ncbi:MAG: LD-carboxypeptidase [Planctomycetes bacterium]|nr:LD-carboxypeptidase [Planctomycetota bacterium]MCB9918017.1 LD-carboxypeptidase [Planctomycetota bacterium]
MISPASPLREDVALTRGIARWKRFGFELELLPHARSSYDYPAEGDLAGTDDERLADLQRALDDPKYRAVMCTRGGYGCTRLLPQIDWTKLAKDPKPILGYSDVTALLAAAWREIGLVGFHGPMVATTKSHAMDDREVQLQHRLLTDGATIPRLESASVPHALTEGIAEGRLVGGNLSLVQALIGTPWEIESRGALLFLEDVGEAPYRIDRMLTQLSQARVFEKCAGVILGDFHVPRTELGHEDARVIAIFRDRLTRLKVPVAHGFAFGHRPRSLTLPFGVRARLVADDASKPARLELLEPSVAATNQKRDR